MSRRVLYGLAVIAVAVLGAGADRSTALAPATMPETAPTTGPATRSGVDRSVFKTPIDAQSYSLGVMTARNFKQLKLEVNMDMLILGIKEEMAGERHPLKEHMIQEYLSIFQSQVRRSQAAVRIGLAQQNKQAGEAFMAANKEKEGVVTLPSGIQYKILKEGTGKTPSDTDTIELKYRGFLVDGKEFDSTAENDVNLTLKLSDNTVIAGWREAIKLMPAGSKWQIVIPGDLAYGARGWGGQIGPNATLIYEVELLSVK